MSTSLDLASIQDIDVTLDEHRTTLRHIDMLLAEDGSLNETRLAIRNSEALLRDLDDRQREAERLADEVRAKLQAEERRLYGGSVTSPKELQSLQHEVEQLQRHRDEREEVLLGLLGTAEEAGMRHASARSQLRTLLAERGAEHAALQKRRTEIELAGVEQETQRLAIAGHIPADMLALYETVRKRRQGRGVARIERDRCSSCRIILPLETVGRARRDGPLAQCPSCERILTAG